MSPAKVTVVSQICTHNSSLDPFATVNGWSLPFDIYDQTLQLAITDPWTFSSSFHNNFLRSTRNLRLLTESVTFPSFGHSYGIKKTLKVEQLYNDLLVLQIPFFRPKVSSFILLMLKILTHTTCSEDHSIWYAIFPSKKNVMFRRSQSPIRRYSKWSASRSHQPMSMPPYNEPRLRCLRFSRVRRAANLFNEWPSHTSHRVGHPRRSIGGDIFHCDYTES